MASHFCPAPNRDSAAALRAHAAVAIAALGHGASMMVPVGSLTYYGSRLGWPDWLYTGSSLAGQDGPPPPHISTADDLIISANLFAHVGAAALAIQSISGPQPAAGSVTRLALAHAPTLKSIFSYLRRMLYLSSPHSRPAMGIADETAFIGLDGAVPLGGLLDYLGLLFIAFHYRVIDDLNFADAAGATITLTLPEGPDSAALKQLFRCDVRFGAAANRLFMPAAWLELSNPGHDAQLWAIAGERLRAAEAHAEDSATIRRLRERISEMLTAHRQAPRLKQVALAEAMSTRTLVRQLAAAGHSFHGIVDQERRLRAAHLINDPALSIRTISGELGFPDVSSFGRKFRQWFGDSPGRFRRGKL